MGLKAPRTESHKQPLWEVPLKANVAPGQLLWVPTRRRSPPVLPRKQAAGRCVNRGGHPQRNLWQTYFWGKPAEMGPGRGGVSVPACLAPLQREISPGCISKARARALGCSWVARCWFGARPIPAWLYVFVVGFLQEKSVRGWPRRASATSVACRCLILELA